MSLSSGDCAARAWGTCNTTIERYKGRAYPIAGSGGGDTFLHAFAASFPLSMPVIKGICPAARFSAASTLIFATSPASPASPASSAEDAAGLLATSSCSDAD